jgi:hypothetical protein
MNYDDGKQDACLKILSSWIVEFKKKTWHMIVKSNNDSAELEAYKDALEQHETSLRKAIYLEDIDSLRKLGWPEELMDCIKDMAKRTDISDMLYESLATHHFNRSPQHEKELHEENSGLQ